MGYRTTLKRTRGCNKVMQNTSKLLRAVTAVFARRLLKRILLLMAVVGLLLVTVVVLLATKIDPTWSLAFVVIGPFLLIGATMGLVAWLAVNRLQPRRFTRKESKEIYGFTTKIFDLAGRVKTPWPVLVASILKSVLLGRESNTVSELINESKSLRADFVRLRDSMED